MRNNVQYQTPVIDLFRREHMTILVLEFTVSISIIILGIFAQFVQEKREVLKKQVANLTESLGESEKMQKYLHRCLRGKYHAVHLHRDQIPEGFSFTNVIRVAGPKDFVEEALEEFHFQEMQYMMRASAHGVLKELGPNIWHADIYVDPKAIETSIKELSTAAKKESNTEEKARKQELRNFLYRLKDLDSSLARKGVA